ncbi:MAG: 16S rRNA (uracil(1498)-N(3))-methyltransferase [Deltaproteobacteria bacterium]|nr:16S rRNA (uracil(1498)-N(3))-methyltransferase [Deltaproteobacteria bacterium]
MACGDVLFLSPSEARHGALVLRLKAGDRVEVLGAGALAQAEVLSSSKGPPPALAVRITGPFGRSPAPPPPAVAGISLVRPQAFEWAAEKASELGCALLVPVVAARSRFRGPDPAGRLVRRARLLAAESRKQCGRDSEMEVSDPLTLAAFLEGLGSLCGPEVPGGREFRDGPECPGGPEGTEGGGRQEACEGPEGLEGSGSLKSLGSGPESPKRPTARPIRLLADRDGPPALKFLEGLPPGDLDGGPAGIRLSRPALLVGPEGGLDPEEKDAAFRAGFMPVSLGPYTLKTETAATALLAALAGVFLARRGTPRNP